MMTNWHVFNEPSWADNLEVVFGYERDIKGNQLLGKKYVLNPSSFFHSNQHLDYAVVLVTGEPGREWGYLDPTGHFRLKEMDRVNIIQHPNLNPKQIAIRENEVKKLTDEVFLHLADTDEGSSGSPALNDRWELVGLHHGWEYLKKYVPEAPEEFKLNEAIRIDVIWLDLEPKLREKGLM
jgi:endonuclease G